MEVAKVVDGPHKIIFYYLPIKLKESPDEAIRPRGFVARPMFNGIAHLLLGERCIKIMKVTSIDVMPSQLKSIWFAGALSMTLEK